MAKFTTEFYDKLSQEEKLDLLKKLEFKIFTYGFRQATTEHIMRDGTKSFFTYNHNANEEYLFFFHDFDVRRTRNNQRIYNIHKLPTNKKTLKTYFKFMLGKFDGYYEKAKEFWASNSEVLSILELAKKQAPKAIIENFDEENINSFDDSIATINKEGTALKMVEKSPTPRRVLIRRKSRERFAKTIIDADYSAPKHETSYKDDEDESSL